MQTILFLDTNMAGNGTRAMLHAKADGFWAHFLARTPWEYHDVTPNPVEVADEVTVVDTYEIAKLLRVAHGRDDVVAVMAFDELRVVQAAMVGEYLGVQHNPPVEALLKVRFKDLTRRALTGSLFAVRHVVCPLSDAPDTSPIGYPCVAKPIDEAASAGVRVCRDDTGFRDAVATIRELVDRPNNREYRLLPTFLVEEYVDGEEYSAEMAWSTRLQDWRLIGYTQKQVTPEPHCLEVGHVFPFSFGSQDDERILSRLRACLRLLGLRDTVVHLEFRVHGDDIRVIEVNPRAAGDRIAELAERTLGLDLVKVHLAAHLGTADALLDAIEQRGYAGIRFLIPPHLGTIQTFEVEPSNDPALLDQRIAAAPLVVDELASNEGRLGHVVVWGNSPDEVTKRLDEHIGRITPRYQASGEAMLGGRR